MDSKIFVKDLKPKEKFKSIYLVKYIACQEGKDGRSYLNLILSDKTGDIEARKWQGAEKVAETVSKGDFVEIEGTVNAYQGRLQVVTTSVNKVDESSVDKGQFVSKSASNVDQMASKLLSYLESIEDIYLRELSLSVFNDYEINRRLKLWSAGKSIHHACQGGLMEHILECVELGDYLSKFFKVNHSFVVAAAFLHDVGKIFELTDGLSVEYTEEGRLIGHVVSTIEIVDRFMAKIKNFPNVTRLHLKHMLLSHHGELEYGSPKVPMTREAELLHLIDLLDSKMASFQTVIETDRQVGHWSSFVKHLDRIVYKDELPTFTEMKEEKVEDHSGPKLGDLLKNVP